MEKFLAIKEWQFLTKLWFQCRLVGLWLPAFAGRCLQCGWAIVGNVNLIKKYNFCAGFIKIRNENFFLIG